MIPWGLLAKASLVGSLAASFAGAVFGLLAAHEAMNPATGAQIAIVAVITAMTGLFGGVALPAWKIWLEFRDKTSNDLRQILLQIQHNQDDFKATIRKIDTIVANQQAYLKQKGIAEPPGE